MQAASSAELTIGEEIVRDRDEFRIYTNLAQRIESDTTMSPQARNERDDFGRRGLDWVMGLARVELGAILAGFSSHPEPFQVVAPEMSTRVTKRSEYGNYAFLEILTDGLRTHYWAVTRDPVVLNYHKTGIPENHIITYGRRVSMARHFYRAVRGFRGNRLSREQIAETDNWDAKFRRMQLVYLYCLALKQQAWETTRVAETHTKDTVRACPPLVAAAKRELGIDDSSEKTSRRVSDFKVSRHGSRLAELLRAIDPTLIACPCL